MHSRGPRGQVSYCCDDRMTGLFADGYAAWVWLTTPRPSLDGAEPLALLARDEVERVVKAVQGDRQGDFA